MLGIVANFLLHVRMKAVLSSYGLPSTPLTRLLLETQMRVSAYKPSSSVDLLMVDLIPDAD